MAFKFLDYFYGPAYQISASRWLKIRIVQIFLRKNSSFKRIKKIGSLWFRWPSRSAKCERSLRPRWYLPRCIVKNICVKMIRNTMIIGSVFIVIFCGLKKMGKQWIDCNSCKQGMHIKCIPEQHAGKYLEDFNHNNIEVYSIFETNWMTPK